MAESDDFCLIHGYTLRYDMRSGFHVCDECEQNTPKEGVSLHDIKDCRLGYDCPEHGHIWRALSTH
jgi:hypothetical protein